MIKKQLIAKHILLLATFILYQICIHMQLVLLLNSYENPKNKLNKLQKIISMQSIPRKFNYFAHSKSKKKLPTEHSPFGSTTRQNQARQLMHLSSNGLMLRHRKTQSLQTDLCQRPTFGCITPANNRISFKNGFCFKIPEFSKHEDLEADSSDADNITSIYQNSKECSDQLQFLRSQLEEIILRNQKLEKECEFLQYENILEKQKLQQLNKENLLVENIRLKQILQEYQNIPSNILHELQALKRQNCELRYQMNHKKSFKQF